MILKTTNIVKAYKGRKVVDNVNIKVSQGEIVGLLGPNGAGKTTCFYMMVGLIKSDLGSILLNDKNISNKPMYERAKLGIGYLAQEASVFRKLTVEDNIKAVLEIGSLSKLDQNKKLEELIEEFSLQKGQKK